MSNVADFDPSRDVIATSTDREIPLATLASYKSIVWSVFSDLTTTSVSRLPLLYQYISSGRPNPRRLRRRVRRVTVFPAGDPNGIALAMQAGAHVLIAGQQPVQNVLPRRADLLVRWPMIPLYETEDPQTGSPDLTDPPGDHGFAYQDLCLEAIDYGYLPTPRARIPGTGATAGIARLPPVTVNPDPRRRATTPCAMPSRSIPTSRP